MVLTFVWCKYLIELGSTPGAESIDFVPEFIEKCERNIDLAWLVHFLCDTHTANAHRIQLPCHTFFTPVFAFIPFSLPAAPASDTLQLQRR